MQQQYTYSRGFRIFVFCLVTPFALVPLVAFGTTILGGVTLPLQTLCGFLLVLPGLALATYCVNEMLSEVTSDATGIRYRSFLCKRELLWQEVKGYQLKEGSLVLLPAVTGKRKVRISRRRRNFREIADWIAARFPKLGEVAVNVTGTEDKTDIVASYELKMARKIAWVLNLIGFVVMLLCFFFVRSMPWLPLILVVLLPVTLITFVYYKGQPVMISRKKEPFSLVLVTIIFCAIGLFVFAGPIFNITLKELWLGAFAVTGVFTVGIIYAIRHWKTASAQKTWGVISFIIFCTPAFFESLVYLNVFFDHSKPQFFETKVFDKRASRRRSTSYFLVVEPWGPVKSPVLIPVGKRKYVAANVDDIVRIELHEGAFEIPWYTPRY
ncbi:hypothetical protein HGH92_29915 [Chitinophaga varians]|uniref:Uncharacterized protein n=1 Tax=Chitinophaga varians TaxID=2202339 RepID=A0A847S6X8_9BACT|nr:hypothetical protein [Chitinophaga varians]NLR68557.1 hypothetical protein [Chitinophaga varians]